MSTDQKFPTCGSHLLTLFCLALSTLVLSGCSSESMAPVQTTELDHHDHDHPHHHGHNHGHEAHSGHSDQDNPHPETFHDAVNALVEMNKSISHAFGTGDGASADSQVHAIGHLLNELNGLAKKSEMTTSQRDSVQMAVTKLFESFAAVDAALHGKDGISYDEASMMINDNLQVLQDLCAGMKS